MIDYKNGEDALASILWYNGYLGHEEDLGEGETYFVDDLIELLDKTIKKEYKPKHGFLGAEDIGEYCKCPRLENLGTEEHCVYMMLVGMFGDWGTSIRGGWIEDCEECKKWLEEAKAWVMGEGKDE